MKTLLAWICIPLTLCSFYLGWSFGWDNRASQDQHPGAEELKITIHNLESNPSTLSPQLKEYLKARSYALLIDGVRAGWVDGAVDHGPIDRELLGDLMVVKGPSSDEELYRLAMDAAKD